MSFTLWGAIFTVCTTLRMAPALIRYPACTAPRTSSRSEYIIADILPVSAETLRTSANCSRVVTAGLSLRKSLPRFMAPVSKWRPQPRNRRARDQLQRGVVEDFILALRQLCIGIQLLEIGNSLGQVGVK